MAASRSDDIRYVKLVLLLVKGGTHSAKRLILKISTSDKKCIEYYLIGNKKYLYSAKKKNLLSQKQISILFPSSTTTTNLECWDISLLSFILLNIFDDKLESQEKKAITALREKRNELQGHPASTAMSEAQFLGEWSHLTMVLYQLTKGLTTAEQDEIHDTVSKILTIQDFQFATNELEVFEGLDEFVDRVITEKLKGIELGFNDSHKKVDELTAKCVKMQEKQDIMARIIVNAFTPAEGDIVQAKLFNELKQIVSCEQHQTDKQNQYGEQDQTDEQDRTGEQDHTCEQHQTDKQDRTCGDEVTTVIKNFVSDINDKGVKIVKVEKGSIVITFRCSTISSLKNISKYFADRMYKERLTELENALSKYVGSTVKLNINIVLETLRSALELIEEDANNTSIMLTLQCRGSEGVKNAVDCFGNGSSTNALNNLSEALSRYVGHRVELHTTIDVDKLENDITELKRQLNLGDQNSVHELSKRMETSLKLSTTKLLPDETAPTESSPRSKHIEELMVAWTKPSSPYSSHKSPQLSKDSHQATLYRQQPFADTLNLPTGLAFTTETCKEHASRVRTVGSWLEQTDLCSEYECERFKGHRATLHEMESYYPEGDRLSGATSKFYRHYWRHLIELPCGCFEDDPTGDYITVEALGAAGCVVDMAYLVGTGKLKNGLVFVPLLEGHFGKNIKKIRLSFAAIAAKQMKEKLNMKKILIIGWNASNGMCTQIATYDDKAILYISLHDDMPWNPYQEYGKSDECGSRNAEGFNLNIVFDSSAGDAEYLAALRNIVMPIACEFNPEIVLVFGGFYAMMSPECVCHMTSELMSLADGKVVLIAEVGDWYLSESKSADMCLKTLLGKEITPLKENQLQERPSTQALQALERTIQIQLNYWPCLQIHLTSIHKLLSEAQKEITDIATLSKDEDMIRELKEKTYVDNPYNRKLGRVGLHFLPHSMVSAPENRTRDSYCSDVDPRKAAFYETIDQVYVDNYQNRKLGRVGVDYKKCNPTSQHGFSTGEPDCS